MELEQSVSAEALLLAE
ncbi:hypothetical protein PF007_g13050, partial [Phytophthora fragariae]